MIIKSYVLFAYVIYYYEKLHSFVSYYQHVIICSYLKVSCTIKCGLIYTCKVYTYIYIAKILFFSIPSVWNTKHHTFDIRNTIPWIFLSSYSTELDARITKMRNFRKLSFRRYTYKCMVRVIQTFQIICVNWARVWKCRSTSRARAL